MIQEKQLIVWKDFRPQSVKILWNKLNNLYADGWRASDNKDNSRAEQAVISLGKFQVMMVRDCIEITHDKINEMTKVVEYEAFAKEHGIEYDPELCKTPMKFKKFLRDVVEGVAAKEAESGVVRKKKEKKTPYKSGSELFTESEIVSEPTTVEPVITEPVITEVAIAEQPISFAPEISEPEGTPEDKPTDLLL